MFLQPLECPEVWRPNIEFVNEVEVEADEDNAEFYSMPYVLTL
eukprot:COSAG06_NODE_16761_length_982_cov_1.510759_1_plen_43_part_00